MSTDDIDRRFAERRHGERRKGDRRQGGRRHLERRLFRDADAGPDAGATDSRFASEESSRPPADDMALLRVARTYAAARALLGLALVMAQAAASLAGQGSRALVVTVCVAYAGQSLITWLLPRFGRLPGSMVVGPSWTVPRSRRWTSVIGVDIVTFVALHLLDRASSFNFAALLVLPVLMSGVLLPRIAALAVAAGSALLLLFAAWEGREAADAATVALTRAGLGGIGLFAIAVLSGELAARLMREEAAARESLDLARRQAQLNRLVIQELSDGVLIVDMSLQVRATNPAARALLVLEGDGPAAPFGLDDRNAWGALAQAAREAVTLGQWPTDGRDVELVFDDGQTRQLRLRVRFMPGHERGAQGASYCVLLLEDLRTAQARLRQERLAAMGRVSAGIAHEIRNPLAAISQANALLLEDALHADQHRLARMVADNVRRLQRIVDEVMELAPTGEVADHVIDARAVVGATIVDWAQTADIELGPASRLHTDLPLAPVGVRFDAEHLRRVVVNLLDNASRHAGPEAGAVLLRLSVRDDHAVVLQVQSSGAPIAADVERHLFEPFFSTRSRGSGLGLYICRELCERYGANIEYRARPASEMRRNEFAVILRHGPLPASDAALPLT